MAYNDAAVRLAELVQPIPPLLQVGVRRHRQREWIETGQRGLLPPSDLLRATLVHPAMTSNRGHKMSRHRQPRVQELDIVLPAIRQIGQDTTRARQGLGIGARDEWLRRVFRPRPLRHWRGAWP